jgi:predicted ATPase
VSCKIDATWKTGIQDLQVEQLKSIEQLNMIKYNFYILTGGPGGGKTSLLHALMLKGYSHIPETARQIIKERLSKGLEPRPDPKTFALEIFNRDWINFVTHSDQSSLLFFDRSFMDSAGMISKCDISGFNKIRDTISNNRYNTKIFITPPWKEIYQNDTERDQSFEAAIEVYEWIDKWYRQHDYDPVIIPKDTIENRAKFILSEISKSSKTKWHKTG